MKKNLLNSKFIRTTLFITALFCTGTVFAQITILDGQTVDAGEIDPGSAVIIHAGGTLDMAGVTQNISSLTTVGAGVSTISGTGLLILSAPITIAAANTLSVAVEVQAPNLTTANLTNQIATVTGPGIITVDDLIINGTNGNSATFVIGSGLTIQTEAIASDAGNNQTIYNLVVDGILKIDGAVATKGPNSLDNFTCNAGSIVEYNGAAQSIFATNYHHLILSGNGLKAFQNMGGPGTPLVFAGDVTIGTGTTLANNNKPLSVGGNWINNGAFTQGAGPGIVTFSGTSLQTIGGTQPTTFSNITFANTNGGVTLTKPVTVTANATFTSGIVTSDATNLLIFNDDATSSLIPAMATTSSYVSGPVRKIGNDAFIFPVGKANGFVPIAISAVAGAGNTFTAEYMRSTPPNRDNITAVGIQGISACEFWTLDRSAGTTAVDLTFYWNANSPCGGAYISDAQSMRAVRYNGTEWNTASTGFGTGTPGSGSVTWGGVNTFNSFALGTTDAIANPLPVVFAEVKAYEKNNGVQIEWSNLTEKDVAEYTIERSVNGRDFSAIGQQLPTSNQNDKASYDAFDAAPNTGANYYRIKAEETTGKIVYSKILSVNLGKTNQGLKLYPNPVSGNQVTISLSNVKKGQYNLRVVNTAGQDIFKQTINNHSSSLTQTIDLPASVKPGVYNMIVTGNDYRESKMFIAQ